MQARSSGSNVLVPEGRKTGAECSFQITSPLIQPLSPHPTPLGIMGNAVAVSKLRVCTRGIQEEPPCCHPLPGFTRGLWVCEERRSKNIKTMEISFPSVVSSAGFQIQGAFTPEPLAPLPLARCEQVNSGLPENGLGSLESEPRCECKRTVWPKGDGESEAVQVLMAYGRGPLCVEKKMTDGDGFPFQSWPITGPGFQVQLFLPNQRVSLECVTIMV